MKRLVLGVIGHVDHGKSTLVRALTGMETDRLSEEKRRGVSIALGFAHAEIGGAEVDFVDAPGHERFVRTLVGGVTGADAVLLVVAADEGIKPQTREHLAIAALLGVRAAIVAVSKCDHADADAAARAGAEAVTLATDLGLAVRGPVAVAARVGLGLEALRREIGALAADCAAPADDGFAYLPLDRAFLIAGQGAVATGTLRRGVLRPDAAMVLLPAATPVRIRGLQVHGRPVDLAEPGQRTAVNLRGVELDQIPRGTVLASAGVLAPAEWLTVELRGARDAPPLVNGARLDLLIGTALVPATVRLLDRDALAAGQTAFAQLRAHVPVAVPARDAFVLRTASPVATVAGGRVLDPVTRRLRRREPARLRQLARLAGAQGPELVEQVIADAGARGVALARLAQLSGLSPERAAAGAAALGARSLKGGVVVGRAGFARAQAEVVETLDASPGALARDELARRCPRIGLAGLDAALSALAAVGRVRAEAGRFALIRPEQDRARAEAAATLARRLARLALEGGLAPPDVAAEARTPEARRVLDALLRSGEIVRTHDAALKRNILFHRAAVEAARRELAPRLAPPGLTLGEAGRILGISRKYSLPLLEHLDRIRFTRRVGDRRVLAEALSPVSSFERGGD